MLAVYTTAAARRFRLRRGLRDASFVSGSLSSPTHWRQDSVSVHSELHVTRRDTECRVHLGFVADRSYDAVPEDKRGDLLRAYGTLRYELFGHVATEELLQGLGAACRRRVDDLAGRLTYVPQRNGGDLSLGMYIDLSTDELSRQPIPAILRSVLRYSPRTFPRASIDLSYDP